MTIQQLQISYPDFQMGATINPQEFDTNNGEIVAKINEIIGATNSTVLFENIASFIYPVNSIYMSVSDVNPSTVFGGTWVAWGSGKVPVGVDVAQTEFDAVEKEGGEKTHTLTINEVPSHSHTVFGGYGASGSSYYGYYGGDGLKATASEVAIGATNAVGGNGAHNNLQPYITCYMWKRTA